MGGRCLVRRGDGLRRLLDFDDCAFGFGYFSRRTFDDGG